MTPVLLLTLLCYVYSQDLGPPLGMLSVNNASQALPEGDAAWFYDYSYIKKETSEQTQTGEWKAQIEWFNTDNLNNPISTVFTYGGDYEKYSTMEVYFTAGNQQAAIRYKQTRGVKQVIAVTDGRMDGGQNWSPDLSKLTTLQLDRLGDAVATVYCSYDFISGIQVDLEPYSTKYQKAVKHLLNRISEQFRSFDLGCVNQDHPHGRSLNYFLFGKAVDIELMRALGPNGFVTVSGYDLSSAPAGTPNPLENYTQELKESMEYLFTTSFPKWEKELGWVPHAMVGIPAAASDHEFTRYTDENGTITPGAVPTYSKTGPNYITSALETVTSYDDSKYYLGKAYWAFTHFAGNGRAEPANPFVIPGEGEFLKAYKRAK